MKKGEGGLLPPSSFLEGLFWEICFCRGAGFVLENSLICRFLWQE